MPLPLLVRVASYMYLLSLLKLSSSTVFKADSYISSRVNPRA